MGEDSQGSPLQFVSELPAFRSRVAEELCILVLVSCVAHRVGAQKGLCCCPQPWGRAVQLWVRAECAAVQVLRCRGGGVLVLLKSAEGF